jgi:DNA-binding protein YbaB
MFRTAVVALALIGAIALPPIAATPALACGVVFVPTNTKAELAAIRKALSHAKLSADDKEKVAKLLAAAAKPAVSKPDREKAISEAMRIPSWLR